MLNICYWFNNIYPTTEWITGYDREMRMKYFEYIKILELSETEILYTHSGIMFINSSPHSAAYMRWWIGSALVQIIACCLDGAKPLSEPMLTYCQLDPKEHISMKFYFKFKYFHLRKCVWICCLRNWGLFVQGGWVNSFWHIKTIRQNRSGWHFIKYWFVVWQHNAITQTNVDLS